MSEETPSQARVAGAAPAEVRAALARCAEITTRAGSNFYLAFLPLPKERREGIFCVYAFCRVVDDAVDEPAPGTDPRRELDAWRRRVRQIVRRELPAGEHPVAVGLAHAHRLFPLREEDLLAVIDGCETDLDRQRHDTWAELDLYCERVAGRVGCLCLPVFGASDAARPFALVLGRAFQLTNILRDVPRDAELGRVYLPIEELDAHGVSDEDLLARRRTPEIERLLHDVGERALGLFQQADRMLVPSERPVLYPALIMAAIYRRLLETMREHAHDTWDSRPRLPGRVKALLALGVLVRDRVLRTW